LHGSAAKPAEDTASRVRTAWPPRAGGQAGVSYGVHM